MTHNTQQQEHTHLGSIDVSKDGTIHFSFETHPAHTQAAANDAPAVSSISLADNFDSARAAEILNGMAQHGMISHAEAHQAAAQLGMEELAAQHLALAQQPAHPHPAPAPHQPTVGHHTAQLAAANAENYLQQANGGMAL